MLIRIFPLSVPEDLPAHLVEPERLNAALELAQNLAPGLQLTLPQPGHWESVMDFWNTVTAIASQMRLTFVTDYLSAANYVLEYQYQSLDSLVFFSPPDIVRQLHLVDDSLETLLLHLQQEPTLRDDIWQSLPQEVQNSDRPLFVRQWPGGQEGQFGIDDGNRRALAAATRPGGMAKVPTWILRPTLSRRARHFRPRNRWVGTGELMRPVREFKYRRNATTITIAYVTLNYLFTHHPAARFVYAKRIAPYDRVASLLVEPLLTIPQQ